jgi:hypothetical protein
MKSIFKPPKHAKASAPHRAVLELLQAIYPGFAVLENQTIEASDKGRKCKLEVDLVLKELKVAIEVNGEQHYKFNQFFHPTIAHFHAQQSRDIAKAEAIADAGFTLVCIPDTEIKDLTTAKLANRIAKAIRG